MSIEQIGFWISVGSLLTMLVIAVIQFLQLNDMKKIGDDTRETLHLVEMEASETAHILEADLHKHIMVEKFFCPENDEKYICIFAAMNVKRHFLTYTLAIIMLFTISKHCWVERGST